MPSRADENLDQTFESLFTVIRSETFLQRRGLGGDHPFFISAFHPSLQPRVDVLLPDLATRLSNLGISVLLLDLYDLVVELLKKEDRWDRLLAKQLTEPRDRFQKTMENATDPENRLVPFIADKLNTSGCKVLL